MAELVLDVGASGIAAYATASEQALETTASVAVDTLQYHASTQAEAAAIADAYETTMSMVSSMDATTTPSDPTSRDAGGNFYENSQLESIGSRTNGFNFRVWNGSNWV
jgi:hypothetical protein